MCIEKHKTTLLCYGSASAVSTHLTMADNSCVVKASGRKPVVQGIVTQAERIAMDDEGRIRR